MEIVSNRESRLFTIVKGLLISLPFFCLIYLRLGGTALTAGGVLTQQPEAAIAFLAAMLQPYAAYLLGLSQRRLEDGRTQYALVNLCVLLAVEGMLMSSIGMIGVGLLTYRVCKACRMGLGAAWRACSPRRLFAEAGGSMLLLPFAFLCLFATIRTGGLF